MAARGGCLIMLLVLGLVTGEVWFAIVASGWIYGEPEVLGALLGMIVLSIIGYQVLRFRLNRLAPAVMGGRPGPAMVAVLGAILLVIPGYVTGACGLLLQLPPVQTVCGKLASRVFAVVLRRAMGRMGGGFPPGSFPGGFPGGPGFPGGGPGGGSPFPPGAFPGGFPGGSGGLSPDARSKRGKIIDVAGERVDDKS